MNMVSNYSSPSNITPFPRNKQGAQSDVCPFLCTDTHAYPAMGEQLDKVEYTRSVEYYTVLKTKYSRKYPDI